jgi:hypothetical protein
VLRAPDRTQPLALLLPVDTEMSIRLDAAARLTHRPGATAAYSPTPFQRTRLVLLLHILDAVEVGMSKREIARRLIYRHMPDLHGATWKGSSERRRIHRLALEAVRLRDDGIGDLLHGRLHRPG